MNWSNYPARNYSGIVVNQSIQFKSMSNHFPQDQSLSYLEVKKSVTRETWVSKRISLNYCNYWQLVKILMEFYQNRWIHHQWNSTFWSRNILVEHRYSGHHCYHNLWVIRYRGLFFEDMAIVVYRPENGVHYIQVFAVSHVFYRESPL